VGSRATDMSQCLPAKCDYPARSQVNSRRTTIGVAETCLKIQRLGRCIRVGADGNAQDRRDISFRVHG